MALGNQPLFLESSVKAVAAAKAPKNPEPLATPIVHAVTFTMQSQQQSNWCWAAVAASVADYYDPPSGWTQYTVVNAVNGRTDCCHFPTSTACNCPGSVADALTATGNLASVGGPVSKETIIGELQAGRPTAARVAWVGKLKAPARFILENDDGQKAS